MHFISSTKRNTSLKSKKQFLDLEDEEENIHIGFARLVTPISDYELFYKINALNLLSFSRTEDIIVHGKYFDFYFSKFEAYHDESMTKFKFIANKNSRTVKTKEQTELFSDEGDTLFLLNNYQDVDYIITSSDTFPDFSLLLQPKDTMFGIQNFSLSPQEELYRLIHYYE